MVDLLVVGLRRDHPGTLRIPHDDVRIRTRSDVTLSGVDVEDLGAVRRGHSHELTRGELSGAHTVGPQHCHAILDAIGAVGDQPEVILAHLLLRSAEAAVVGRRGL